VTIIRKLIDAMHKLCTEFEVPNFSYSKIWRGPKN